MCLWSDLTGNLLGISCGVDGFQSGCLHNVLLIIFIFHWKLYWLLLFPSRSWGTVPLDANWVVKFLKASSRQALLGVLHTPGAAVVVSQPRKGKQSPALFCFCGSSGPCAHLGCAPRSLSLSQHGLTERLLEGFWLWWEPFWVTKISKIKHEWNWDGFGLLRL